MSYESCNENTFCKWLKERSQTDGTGLIIRHYVNHQTGKPAGSIVTYVADKKDNGLALNFCPFCGFSFYALYKKHKRVGGGTLEFENPF